MLHQPAAPSPASLEVEAMSAVVPPASNRRHLDFVLRSFGLSLSSVSPVGIMGRKVESSWVDLDFWPGHYSTVVRGMRVHATQADQSRRVDRRRRTIPGHDLKDSRELTPTSL